MNGIVRLESPAPHVALLELQRPPFNHLNPELLAELANALEQIDLDTGIRCTVLAASGKAFSAGADFGSPGSAGEDSTRAFYHHACRLFDTKKPIVAAIHGAAVGAGLGLALAADFRVGCVESRLWANFTRLGFHPGFGLSCTLPRLVGAQQAFLMFSTARRLDGQEAHRIGLLDSLVDAADVRSGAIALAVEIAQSAPVAVQDTRATLRAGFADAVREAVKLELAKQVVHLKTTDFEEGVKAMKERRLPHFTGH